MSLEGTAENSNVPILKGKITTITVPQIDKTLSKAGQSAEAKATGEAIEKVNKTATEGVNEAKSAASAANTAALEAKALVKNSSATVSMNAPTADHNVSAGYQLGVSWIRPNYTLHNIAYSKAAEDFVATACVVTKEGQTVTASGNGDDKVISAALEHGSESGWLYCVVTPDATATSARVIAGGTEIALTVGEANVVNHKFSGTGVTFEATYETANVAETGTIIIDNLTVIDEVATLEQVEDGYRDVTDSTVLDLAAKYAPIESSCVIAANWNHVKDGVWHTTSGMFRIGAVYISLDSTSPAEMFGGIWERLKDTFLLAASDTYAAGSTGGEAEHTLTVDEMPSHRHPSSSGSTSSSGTPANYYHSGDGSNRYTGYTGGDQPHNNMPPYLAVYMWKRIA